MIMSATMVQKKSISRFEIARTAWLIWKNEGCQTGRDEEYRVRAEKQLLAARQQRKAAMNTAAAK